MSKFVLHPTGLKWKISTPGYVEEDAMSDWCNSRIQGHYSNIYMIVSDVTVWFFERRKDAIWFALTWT